MRLFPFVILLYFFIANDAIAQTTNSDSTSTIARRKLNFAVFKDSLDNALDLSSFLIDFHGFIPIPQLITEPALGNIGVVFTPVFIHPNKYKEKGKYIPPDITAAFIGYTGNKSWGFGGMRSASLPKHHIKYRAAVFHGDINMDFYRTLPDIGNRKFDFGFKMTAIFVSVLRQIAKTDLYVGLDYAYAHNDLTPQFDLPEVPDIAEGYDLKANISSLALDMQYDKRDNVFTPDNGSYLLLTYRLNASWLGSDYDYGKLNIATFNFFQPTKKWVSGVRLEGVWLTGGDVPFYLMPYVDMRGVPMARYQGDQIYMLETEQRYDFTRRWSGILIGGLAKALTNEVSFGDAELVYTYGTGFRYLIARKFGLRTGMDVAWSNDDFGWYITFGSAWNNRN